MSEPTTPRESRSSVRLSRHKDGTYYWEIHIYFGDDDSLDHVLADIYRTDATLALQYGPRQPS